MMRLTIVISRAYHVALNVNAVLAEQDVVILSAESLGRGHRESNECHQAQADLHLC